MISVVLEFMKTSSKILFWYLLGLPLITYLILGKLFWHSCTLRQAIIAIAAAATPWILTGIVLRMTAKTQTQKSWRIKALVLPPIIVPVLLVGYHLAGIASCYGWETLVRMLKA